LHPDLAPILEKLPKKSKELVFATRNGTRLAHYDRTFKRCATRAGIEGASIHTLRHTAASHLVMAGVDLATVARILGHRDITTTMVYAHLASDHLQGAIKRLDLL
jgi:site-specific recombinase XerD